MNHKWSAFRKPGLLFLVTAGVWLIAAIPKWMGWLFGDTPLSVSLCAGWLCSIVGMVVFFLTDGLPQRTPEVKVVIVLLATAIRMGGVVGDGIALYYKMPVIHENGTAFIGWLIVFYLATLAVETRLLIAATDARHATSNNGI